MGLTPEVSLVCRIYSDYLKILMKMEKKRSSKNTDDSSKVCQFENEQVIEYLTCIDYLLKGTHLHNCVSKKAQAGDSKWQESHSVINKLENKIPILLGDLYNFKAMKIASKLGRL